MTSTNLDMTILLSTLHDCSTDSDSFNQRYAPGKVIPRICWYNHSPSTASPRPGFPVKMASSA